jgi:glutaredoxin
LPFFLNPVKETQLTIKEKNMAAKIKIYTLSTCSHCKATKKFLNDNKVVFDFVDVDLLQGDEKQKVLKEVMQYNPDRSFPTIIIGDKVIIGFKENAIKEALGI